MLKINKRFLIALLTFTLPFGCVGCSDGGSATYEQISGAEAKALMDSESGYIIIDARTKEEYDQGHIPLKVKGFVYNRECGKWDAVEGVNVTLGLPIIRASVDHGTGFGHAGDGRANELSLTNAIDYAIRMANARKATNA